MSVKYTINQESTEIFDTHLDRRKQALRSILASFTGKFTLSDLNTKLRDGRFEFTSLVDGCMNVYYDSFAKQRSEPLAATIYLIPHIDGK